MSANPDEQHQRQIQARIDACQSEIGNLEAEQQRLAGRYATLKARIDALREELQPSHCQSEPFDQWSADVALAEKRAAMESDELERKRQRDLDRPCELGVLPMIISETGADDEPEIERIICSAISGGADYANDMPRELSLQRITRTGTFSARYLQGPLDVALAEKRGGRGTRPLLAADQWEFVVREMWAEELVPCQVSPFHDDGWQHQVMGNTFAKVQLTRQDGSGVGDLLLRHFCIGPAEYRILEVIEHDGNRAITRCQVQRASDCR